MLGPRVGEDMRIIIIYERGTSGEDSTFISIIPRRCKETLYRDIHSQVGKYISKNINVSPCFLAENPIKNKKVNFLVENII